MYVVIMYALFKTFDMVFFFQEINGTFKLVPQSPGRMPPHSTPAHRPQGQYIVYNYNYTFLTARILCHCVLIAWPNRLIVFQI